MARLVVLHIIMSNRQKSHRYKKTTTDKRVTTISVTFFSLPPAACQTLIGKAPLASPWFQSFPSEKKQIGKEDESCGKKRTKEVKQKKKAWRRKNGFLMIEMSMEWESKYSFHKGSLEQQQQQHTRTSF